MIDRFIYKLCGILDHYIDWMNNIFFSKPKKRKKTESEKMQEKLEPIGILKRGRTSWAMDVNFRFPRVKQRDEKKK
jgi:hypothetical protein|tara:strand:- start:2 stop:229 length:228 start_codon:yes stop_codon:yes gene_type:complete